MTPIVDIDVARPIAPLNGLGTTLRCLVIVRWHRRVIGRVFVPVVEGSVPEAQLTDAISGAVDEAAVASWLDAMLGFDERTVETPVPLTAAVAVCTRERPADLERVLAGIASLEDRPLEVLVIDSAPVTDAARSVAAAWPDVRYVREDGRGLDRARNRALRESRADILAFTDDDAVPEPEWLGALLANFQEPRVAVATGLTLPLDLETEAQELFEERCSFVRGFRRHTFDGQRDNPVAVGAVGAGVNMALRRQLAISLGGFDERLDAGTPTCSGGDHDLFVRVLAAGHSIAYDPAAVVRHRHRRTMQEVVATVRGYGVGVYAMFTGLLLERRELGVLRLAWRWLRDTQLPAAVRSSDPLTRRLARAELRGCACGPRAWLASRARMARQV
jgi:glycosyltransferase involved in cell wall biosynthesis